MSKSPDAFRTISEVAEWLDTPAHVLRFWESKFSQVKPVKRAGGRRYYRPNDMMLLGGIKRLLHQDGLTVKDVQKLLREKGFKHVVALSTFDLGDDENTISANTVVEVEDLTQSEETPIFTSVAPRKEAEAIEVLEDDPENQMSFPGFEFTSDRTKTFETPPSEPEPTPEVPEAHNKPIDISHIPTLDLNREPENSTGELSRLAKLGRGDLDKWSEECAQVRDQLSRVARLQASSSIS